MLDRSFIKIISEVLPCLTSFSFLYFVIREILYKKLNKIIELRTKIRQRYVYKIIMCKRNIFRISQAICKRNNATYIKSEFLVNFFSLTIKKLNRELFSIIKYDFLKRIDESRIKMKILRKKIVINFAILFCLDVYHKK